MRKLLVFLVLALAGCGPSNTSTPQPPPPVVVQPPADSPPEVAHDDRAVIVGINKYPGCPLAGCVNDALAVQERLISVEGFKQSQIRLLLDEQATRNAIWDALKWLREDAKPGDRRFHSFSGHGVEFAGDNSQQPDGLNQCVCPVDFDWTPGRMIRDTEFAKLFGQMPDGVIFNWLSDSCHSGDLTRAPPSPRGKAAVSRHYPKEPPPNVKRNLERAHRAGWRPKGFHQGILDVGYVSGCRYDQTSSDTVEDGKPCGAMTFWLLRALEARPRAPLKDVVALLNELLQANGYEQQPQCEGARNDQPFLK